MATSESTIAYLTDQMARAGRIRSRKMFGEYALYCDDKVIALVCDDRLYIKPTDAGRSHSGTVTEAPPYPGAKQYFLIEEDSWDNGEWLCELVRLTTDALPAPKRKSLK